MVLVYEVGNFASRMLEAQAWRDFAWLPFSGGQRRTDQRRNTSCFVSCAAAGGTLNVMGWEDPTSQVARTSIE